MYYSQRKMVLETLDTMIYVLEEAKKQPQQTQHLAFECIQGIIQVDDFLTQECAVYQSDALQKAVDCLEQLEIQSKNSFYQAMIALQDCKKYVKTLNVRYKVVFFPYIASMWTALESIWMAADSDPDCDAFVIPIPYWNLNMRPDGTSEKTTMEYEGGKYPHYVPVVDYRQFDLEAEHPDIIYTHNPYDDYNNLTRIPEEYYSRNLKKHTEKLIYSPYCIQYAVAENQQVLVLPSFQTVDYILLQSKKLEAAYIKSGISSKKILLLGSPKEDHIVSPIQPAIIPDEWLKKAHKKKVILLNTHMSYIMLQCSILDSKDSFPLGLSVTTNIIDEILSTPDCLLLWRPHPLLTKMLESRGFVRHSEQIRLSMQKVSSAPNGILDFSSDYLAAFSLSDAMISLDWSSLVSEYLLTGKPIIDTKETRNAEWAIKMAAVSPFDPRLLYFRCDFFSDKEWEAAMAPFTPETQSFYEEMVRLTREKHFRGFIQMICHGEDPMKEVRLRGVKDAFINMDGTCGQKVHNKIKNILS